MFKYIPCPSTKTQIRLHFKLACRRCCRRLQSSSLQRGLLSTPWTFWKSFASHFRFRWWVPATPLSRLARFCRLRKHKKSPTRASLSRKNCGQVEVTLASQNFVTRSFPTNTGRIARRLPLGCPNRPLPIPCKSLASLPTPSPVFALPEGYLIRVWNAGAKIRDFTSLHVEHKLTFALA